MQTPSRRPRVVVSAAAAIVMLVLSTNAALAKPSQRACDRRPNNTIAKLLECVRLDGVREHQAALQDIADENGGRRTSGTPGYDASAAYVVDRVEAAGYDVTVQEFDFDYFEILDPTTFAQTSPAATVYVDQVDFDTMTFSGAGDVTATVEGVDLALGDPASSTSGCEAADFAGFAPGNVALVQRGACAFADKAVNAEAAGAVAVVVFNQGNTPEREGLLFGTLGSPVASIPVLGTTFALGVDLAATPTPIVHIDADTLSETRSTVNVLAESRRGDGDNVIMVGAHLDSVLEGPGIQDNGSGSAAILEVAEQLARTRIANKVRFAWWGAEEFGLVGSDHYVFGLPPEELDRIALYLNFDMIGSPNFVRFVYDGDGSTFGLSGPDGSDDIEALFAGFYDDRGLAHDATEISFRSDYAAFFDSGIPFGGLFTGAEGIKTPEQAAIYGGTAGDQYDPCYHLACDTFDNVSLDVLDTNSDAVAFAVLTYARTPATSLPGR